MSDILEIDVTRCERIWYMTAFKPFFKSEFSLGWRLRNFEIQPFPLDVGKSLLTVSLENHASDLKCDNPQNRQRSQGPQHKHAAVAGYAPAFHEFRNP